MSDETKKPGYLISYMKQTSMLGESVQVSFNLPEGSTEEELQAEFTKVGNALDGRMRALNAAVLKRTGKSLEEMGIDTGTVNVPSVFEKAEE